MIQIGQMEKQIDDEYMLIYMIKVAFLKWGCWNNVYI